MYIFEKFSNLFVCNVFKMCNHGLIIIPNDELHIHRETDRQTDMLHKPRLFHQLQDQHPHECRHHMMLFVGIALKKNHMLK